MSRRMMTLGLMQAATRGHDPVAAVDFEFRTGYVSKPYHKHISEWFAAAEQSTQPLTRGDVLWRCIAPIDYAWLRNIPLFAIPFVTGDLRVLRSIAVFIGYSPRHKRHQSLLWYEITAWARAWCEQQPHKLVMLSKRTDQMAFTTVNVYAPKDAKIVADCWRSEDVPDWELAEINLEKPPARATYRPAPPEHLRN